MIFKVMTTAAVKVVFFFFFLFTLTLGCDGVKKRTKMTPPPTPQRCALPNCSNNKPRDNKKKKNSADFEMAINLELIKKIKRKDTEKSGGGHVRWLVYKSKRTSSKLLLLSLIVSL